MCACFATYYLGQNYAEIFLDFEHPTREVFNNIELRNFVSVGWGASIVAHFARKVRGTNFMANTSQRSGYIADLWHFRDVSVALTLRAK